MDWLYATVGFFVIIATAILLGWTEMNVKSRTAKVFIWIGAILALLAIRFFDGQPVVFVALSLLALLEGIKHIPPWLTRTVGWFVVVFVGRYFLILLVGCFSDLGAEIEKTNARIRLMEDTIVAKLNDISRRLPEQD